MLDSDGLKLTVARGNGCGRVFTITLVPHRVVQV